MGTPPDISRRKVIRSYAAAALTFAPILSGQESEDASVVEKRGPAHLALSLDQKWLFGGKLNPAALQAGFNDEAFAPITLPHCVTSLSWQNWDPASWEHVWMYRRHFGLPRRFAGQRVYLHFDHAMAAVTPVVNGHSLQQHLGGFLPFSYEVTGLVNGKENVLAVAVDSRWMNVPPAGSAKGPRSLDYLLPGGITGSVHLSAVPQVFVSDVFAKPVNVLDANRRVEVTCSVDAGAIPSGPIRLEATLKQRSRVIAATAKRLTISKIGETQASLTLTGLQDAMLWDTAAPHLYDLVVTLFLNNEPMHDYRTRIGFREARFETDGFFLNGRRLQLFGLNRHELYPYAGRAMPPRVLRKDAEILRNEFNCNAVRCSHYPQSEAFLDACDELGLLVWEEIPGWQYIGNESWQELAIRDVKEMVRRDRNHPSIAVWGVRINESANDPALYRRAKEAAKSLDDSRPTSGSMVHRSTQDWFQDVFAFDDYHSASDGSVGLAPPLPGVPFFFSEAVGQFSYGGHGFNNKYRRAGDPQLQQKQAIYHAEAHDRAAADKRYGGVIAWCAFEYASLLGDYQGVKYPGVADVFRIPKLGACFYLAQVDPKIRPVIEPNFYWDFGPKSPQGPGKRAAIFSNCDTLELKIDGSRHSILHPDRAKFPNLKYPPFFADLSMNGSRNPELRIDGYVGDTPVLSRSFSSDMATDQLLLEADDSAILGDASDATRLVFRVADKFGAPRAFAGGNVSLSIHGPGVITGDNPFDLAESGGAGAVWIKAEPGSTGRLLIEAEHSSLGKRAAEIKIQSSSGGGSIREEI